MRDFILPVYISCIMFSTDRGGVATSREMNYASSREIGITSSIYVPLKVLRELGNIVQLLQYHSQYE